MRRRPRGRDNPIFSSRETKKKKYTNKLRKLSQRLKSIRIDTTHVDFIRDELPSEDRTHVEVFLRAESSKKYASPEIRKFGGTMINLCHSLAVILYNRSKIVEFVVEQLSSCGDDLAFTVICRTIVLLAKELRHELYTEDGVPLLVPALVSQLCLDSTISLPRLETVFVTFAFLGKFLCKHIVKDLARWIEWFLPLFRHSKPYIRQFAARTLAQYVRRCRSANRLRTSFFDPLIHILRSSPSSSTVDEDGDVEMEEEGEGEGEEPKAGSLKMDQLLFDSASLVIVESLVLRLGQFHSKSSWMLTLVMRQLVVECEGGDGIGEDKVRDRYFGLVRSTFRHLLEYARDESSVRVLLEPFLTELERSDENDGLSSRSRNPLVFGALCSVLALFVAHRKKLPHDLMAQIVRRIGEIVFEFETVFLTDPVLQPVLDFFSAILAQGRLLWWKRDEGEPDLYEELLGRLPASSQCCRFVGDVVQGVFTRKNWNRSHAYVQVIQVSWSLFFDRHVASLPFLVLRTIIRLFHAAERLRLTSSIPTSEAIDAVSIQLARDCLQRGLRESLGRVSEVGLIIRYLRLVFSGREDDGEIDGILDQMLKGLVDTEGVESVPSCVELVSELLHPREGQVIERRNVDDERLFVLGVIRRFALLGSEPHLGMLVAAEARLRRCLTVLVSSFPNDELLQLLEEDWVARSLTSTDWRLRLNALRILAMFEQDIDPESNEPFSFVKTFAVLEEYGLDWERMNAKLFELSKVTDDLGRRSGLFDHYTRLVARFVVGTLNTKYSKYHDRVCNLAHALLNLSPEVAWSVLLPFLFDRLSTTSTEELQKKSVHVHREDSRKKKKTSKLQFSAWSDSFRSRSVSDVLSHASSSLPEIPSTQPSTFIDRLWSVLLPKNSQFYVLGDVVSLFRVLCRRTLSPKVLIRMEQRKQLSGRLRDLLRIFQCDASLSQLVDEEIISMLGQIAGCVKKNLQKAAIDVLKVCPGYGWLQSSSRLLKAIVGQIGTPKLAEIEFPPTIRSRASFIDLLICLSLPHFHYAKGSSTNVFRETTHQLSLLLWSQLDVSELGLLYSRLFTPLLSLSEDSSSPSPLVAVRQEFVGVNRKTALWCCHVMEQILRLPGNVILSRVPVLSSLLWIPIGFIRRDLQRRQSGLILTKEDVALVEFCSKFLFRFFDRYDYALAPSLMKEFLALWRGYFQVIRSFPKSERSVALPEFVKFLLKWLGTPRLCSLFAVPRVAETFFPVMCSYLQFRKARKPIVLELLSALQSLGDQCDDAFLAGVIRSAVPPGSDLLESGSTIGEVVISPVLNHLLSTLGSVAARPDLFGPVFAVVESFAPYFRDDSPPDVLLGIYAGLISSVREINDFRADRVVTVFRRYLPLATEETQYVRVKDLSLMFAHQSSYDLRRKLCNVFRGLSDTSFQHMNTVSEMLHGMHLSSRTRIGEVDAGGIVSQLRRISLDDDLNGWLHNLSDICLMPLSGNAFFFLWFDQMDVRAAALSALKTMVEVVSEEEIRFRGSIELFKEVVLRGLKTPKILEENRYADVFAHMVKNLESYSSTEIGRLGEAFQLLGHPRTKEKKQGLRMILQLNSDDPFTDYDTVVELLYPILLHFARSSKFQKLAMKTIVELAFEGRNMKILRKIVRSVLEKIRAETNRNRKKSAGPSSPFNFVLLTKLVDGFVTRTTREDLRSNRALGHLFLREVLPGLLKAKAMFQDHQIGVVQLLRYCDDRSTRRHLRVLFKSVAGEMRTTPERTKFAKHVLLEVFKHVDVTYMLLSFSELKDILTQGRHLVTRDYAYQMTLKVVLRRNVANSAIDEALCFLANLFCEEIVKNRPGEFKHIQVVAKCFSHIGACASDVKTLHRVIRSLETSLESVEGQQDELVYMPRFRAVLKTLSIGIAKNSHVPLTKFHEPVTEGENDVVMRDTDENDDEVFAADDDDVPSSVTNVILLLLFLLRKRSPFHREFAFSEFAESTAPVRPDPSDKYLIDTTPADRLTSRSTQTAPFLAHFCVSTLRRILSKNMVRDLSIFDSTHVVSDLLRFVGEKDASLAVVSLRTLSLLCQARYPPVLSRAQTIIDALFRILSMCGVETSPSSWTVLYESFRLFMKQRDVSIPETKMQFLLDSLKLGLLDNTGCLEAYRLVKTLVFAKHLAPQIYDIATKLRDTVLTHNSAGVRELSKSILLQFFLSYDMEPKVLLDHVMFLTKNVMNPSISVENRIFAISIFRSIVSKFPSEFLFEKVESFFVPMAFQFYRDDSDVVQAEIRDALLLLLRRLRTDLTFIRRVLAQWLRTPKLKLVVFRLVPVFVELRESKACLLSLPTLKTDILGVVMGAVPKTSGRAKKRRRKQSGRAPSGPNSEFLLHAALMATLSLFRSEMITIADLQKCMAGVRHCLDGPYPLPIRVASLMLCEAYLENRIPRGMRAREDLSRLILSNFRLADLTSEGLERISRCLVRLCTSNEEEEEAEEGTTQELTSNILHQSVMYATSELEKDPEMQREALIDSVLHLIVLLCENLRSEFTPLLEAVVPLLYLLCEPSDENPVSETLVGNATEVVTFLRSHVDVRQFEELYHQERERRNAVAQREVETSAELALVDPSAFARVQLELDERLAHGGKKRKKRP